MTERPDGGSAEEFRKHLALIRNPRPDGAIGQTVVLPALHWTDLPRSQLRGAVRSASTEWAGVGLLVVEMGEGVLARTPSNVPKISWSLCDERDGKQEYSGGPAPSFEDAISRAELALRAYLGLELNS
jgi:hypothetical protein